MELGPEALADGYRLSVVDATGSTNDDLMDAAFRGDPGRLWLVARRQLAGRGRQGRVWASPAGNLYASLLLADPCPPPLAPRLGFLAGVALHEAVEAATGLGAPRLALKWPNDLLLSGAKVAGLLLEGRKVPAGFAVVIGFGVNVAVAPEGTPYPASSLQAAQPGLFVGTLFRELSSALARRLAGGRVGLDNFEPLRRAWTERAAAIGSTITVRLPAGPREGLFDGLDGSGRLRLRTPAGLELIEAGDILYTASAAVSAAPSLPLSG